MVARGVGVRYNMGADQMDVRALSFAPTPIYHWPEKGQLQQGAIPHRHLVSANGVVAGPFCV